MHARGHEQVVEPRRPAQKLGVLELADREHDGPHGGEREGVEAHEGDQRPSTGLYAASIQGIRTAVVKVNSSEE